MQIEKETWKQVYRQYRSFFIDTYIDEIDSAADISKTYELVFINFYSKNSSIDKVDVSKTFYTYIISLKLLEAGDIKDQKSSVIEEWINEWNQELRWKSIFQWSGFYIFCIIILGCILILIKYFY